MKVLSLILSIVWASFSAQANNSSRWEIAPDGSIVWRMKGTTLPHSDHIEMSGKQVSVVLRYGVNSNGAFEMTKGMVWPMLRTLPNNTHASLMRRFSWNPLAEITVDNKALENEKVEQISLKGMMTVESSYSVGWSKSCKLIREYLPSCDKPTLIEIYSVINTSSQPLYVEIPEAKSTTLMSESK